MSTARSITSRRFARMPASMPPPATGCATWRIRRYWAHESPDGRSPFTWLEPNGYTFHYAGENLATGFDTTEVLVEGWMESPGHRANILSPHFEDCGIAIIDGMTMRRGAGKSIVVMFGATR